MCIIIAYKNNYSILFSIFKSHYYYLTLGSYTHRRSPCAHATRCIEGIISYMGQSIIMPPKEKICNNPIWPELSLVRMSTEFEIYTSFCDTGYLEWCMIEEDWWIFFFIISEREYGFCYVFSLARFWIIDTDDIKTIECHYLVSEYASLRMAECTECSIYSKIGLMVTISIDDSMLCSYLVEWIQEMLESSVHTIEEISGDTEEFHVF